MKRKIMLGLALVLGGGLGGCRTVVMPLEQVQPETAAVHLPVRLAKDGAARTDAVGLMGGQQIRSGEILARVFIGTAATEPEIEIVKSEATLRPEDFGFTVVHGYTLAALLTLRGEKIPLNAAGSFSTHGFKMPHTLAQIACERAVLDLAKQVEVRLKPPGVQ